MWISIWTGDPALPRAQTLAKVSLFPNGVTPLNSLCARPLKKLRWLNTALITDGVFLPVTWRTFTPLTLNTGSATDVVSSAPVLLLNPAKVLLRTPCDPVMLSLSVVGGLVNG